MDEIAKHREALKSIYRPFLVTEAGVDLMNYIEGQKNQHLNNALNGDEPMVSWAELQKASAYVVIRDYLERQK